MAKKQNKFFFNESDSPKEKEVKPKKVKQKKNKENSFSLALLFERIKYILKKLLPIIALILLIVIIILGIKACQKHRNNTSSKQTDQTIPQITKSIEIKLGEENPTIDKFISNYENVKGENDTITFDDKNLVDGKYAAIGKYRVTIVIKNKNYYSQLKVVDKDAPILILKEVNITEGTFYNIHDFVTSCVDNSNKDCALSYEKLDYSKYTTPGTYDITIVASDLSGNKVNGSTSLTITAKVEPTPTPTPTPQKPSNPSGGGNNSGCEYGDGTYDKTITLTSNLVKNGCAISPQYAKTDTYISEPDEISKTDYTKLISDLNAKDIDMEVQLMRNVVPVFNTSQKGIVGYRAYTVVTNTANSEVIVEYDIKPNGQRVYKTNKLGL